MLELNIYTPLYLINVVLGDSGLYACWASSLLNNIFCSFPTFIFETEPHYIAFAGLELMTQTRLASNSDLLPSQFWN